MMTLKTNPHRLGLFLIFLLSFTARADEIACLRELLPVTDKVSFQRDRRGLEKPFVLADKFIVFPEIKEGKVSGFYVYGKKRGQYYDVVQAPGKKLPARTALSDLAQGIVYDMVAQPDGLETVTIAFAPQLRERPARTPSSAALGASMLPVVGAFVALQDKKESTPVYIRPELSPNNKNPRKLMQLATSNKKSQDEIARPLKDELEIRRKWIQEANLDDATFKDLSRILQHSCNSL